MVSQIVQLGIGIMIIVWSVIELFAPLPKNPCCCGAVLLVGAIICWYSIREKNIPTFQKLPIVLLLIGASIFLHMGAGLGLYSMAKVMMTPQEFAVKSAEMPVLPLSYLVLKIFFGLLFIGAGIGSFFLPAMLSLRKAKSGDPLGLQKRWEAKQKENR